MKTTVNFVKKFWFELLISAVVSGLLISFCSSCASNVQDQKKIDDSKKALVAVIDEYEKAQAEATLAKDVFLAAETAVDVQEAAKKLEAAYDKVKEAADKVVAADEALKKAETEATTNTAGKILDVVNAFIPGSKYLGEWAIPAIVGAYGLTKRGRKIGKAFITSGVNMDWRGVLQAVAALPGFASSDPSAIAKLQAAREEALKREDSELVAKIDATLLDMQKETA